MSIGDASSAVRHSFLRHFELPAVGRVSAAGCRLVEAADFADRLDEPSRG
jgi:hypothetical protein